MTGFCCPICGEELELGEKNLGCKNNHRFDLSKEGYVNLFLSQQSKQKRHGDDKAMVRARKDFLEKGYYQPLLDGICEAVAEHAYPAGILLDAGCGECWYTDNLYCYLEDMGIPGQFLGIDISKDALRYGAKRNRDLALAVASVFHMPVSDESVDMVLSVFAPCSTEEFHRVLCDDGILFRAVPMERHLWELKAAIYENPYENPKEEHQLNGFTIIDRKEIRYEMELSNPADIQNLFMMTPYYYKTSQADQQKVAELNSLKVTAEFLLLTYRKE